MGVDLPPVTSAEIGSELQKPQAQEVVSVGECKSPDFQKQFDKLQTLTKEKTEKLQEEMQYSEKQKEILRKIYCTLGEGNSELKKAIETQSLKIFEVPSRDLVALSINGKNVDFIYGTNGEIFRNYKIKRENLGDYLILLSMSDIKEKLLIDGKLISLEDFIKQGHKNIPEDTKIIIVSEEGKELNTFSNESLTKYAEWGDYLDKMAETLKGIIDIWDDAEILKDEYIKSFKQFPDYKGSKVEKAIEEGIIEIKKIPLREAIAVYEYNQGNLIYLTNLKGEPYINVDHFRTVQMLSDIFEVGYLRQGYSKIENVDGLWKLYDKDGKEISISSDEYATATLNAINLMLDFSDYIYDEAQSKGLIK